MISTSNLKRAVIGRKLLIDTNIIIYLTDSVPPYAPLAKLLFEMVETGDTEAVFSILSVGEVMHGPIRSNRNALAMEVRDYLINFPNSHCQEISLDVLQMVGNHEQIDWNGLRTIDSLIIASGLYCGTDLFVSNDRHFKKAISRKMILSFD